MFLIDKPFVSDFLVNTIKNGGFPVVATPVARELIADESLNWISEDEAIELVRNKPETRIYSNSENAIGWIAANLAFTNLPGQVNMFKDKFAFREMVKELFPGYSYRTVQLRDIQSMEVTDADLPFVIKPAVGFFSLGVHIVHTLQQWEEAKKELNYESLKSIYPKEVVDTSVFIVEEYIEGEEYAVDCYFDEKGDVVVLNILHHRFASGTDTSDRVYSTSKKIFLRYKKGIEGFLKAIGDKAGLRNFPVHVELRIDESGEIVPIEVNPMRFGGWCTTADLTKYAYGINSYEYFMNGIKPDWDTIFEKKGDKLYSIIVLNNNSGYSTDEISRFNYDRLAADFEHALEIRLLDFKKFGFFGFVFAETDSGNEKELDDILVSDLRKYIQIY